VPVNDPGGWGTRLQPPRREAGRQREGGGEKSHLCVGGTPNWRARIGIKRVGARGLDQVARFGRRHAAAPRLLSVSLSFWVWTKGERENSRGKGEKEPEQPRNGSGGALSPDPITRPTRGDAVKGEHGMGNLSGCASATGRSRGRRAARVS